jgi:CDP-glucose 4,6-dehydratase
MGSMATLTESFWHGRPVFVTGHTGFKGGWLVTWLLEMGAHVTGYALEPDTTPSYFELCRLARKMRSITGDVRDHSTLESALRACAPDVLFHLAAQPLVRRAYREPAATFAVNVMGTVNVLEAARRVDSVRAIVLVTSDKCYYPEPTSNGYEEQDRLGGFDPYSSSKACAEMVALAYSRSFFARSDRPVAAATVRAGNVIGGGDWAADRIVPDAIRALERGEPLKVRNPQAIRPWQHVLEPLVGYLVLAERLLAEGDKWTGAWNFGPAPGTELTVGEIADLVITHWGSGSWLNAQELTSPPETVRLRLNSGKARGELGWTSRLSVNEAVRLTVQWYRAARSENRSACYLTSIEQIHSYQRFRVATQGGQQDTCTAAHS